MSKSKGLKRRAAADQSPVSKDKSFKPLLLKGLKPSNKQFVDQGFRK